MPDTKKAVQGGFDWAMILAFLQTLLSSLTMQKHKYALGVCPPDCCCHYCNVVDALAIATRCAACLDNPEPEPTPPEPEPTPPGPVAAKK